MMFDLLSFAPDKWKGRLIGLLMVGASLGIGPALQLFDAWQRYESAKAVGMISKVIGWISPSLSTSSPNDSKPKKENPQPPREKHSRKPAGRNS